ncbi:DUF2092 domain-containing protein [Streptomyces varsoviensis]|uniref:LolA family protein n=1 Tax=Streptomyces varsoviensis TaxID=67373 RepID=UPI0033CBA04C
MPRIRPTHEADGADGAEEPRTGRRKAVRYGVPVAVAGVAAATIGLVPALASSGDPDLPQITAQDLIAKVAASDTQQLSGSVKVSTDLGLPSLPSGMSFGGSGGSGGKGGGGSDASPQSKLTELAAGTHTLRVAADGPDKQRLSIEEKAAEYSLIHNGDQLWGYDSASNSAYHATVPKDAAPKRSDAAKGQSKDLAKGLQNASPQELAKQALGAVDGSTSVSVDGTAKVAGRDAYQLSVKPKQSGSTIESVRIAVDAKNGVPLKVTVNAKSGGKPVVDAGFTKVDFGKPAASTFDFTPPKGAKVTEAKDAKADAERKGGSDLFTGKGKGKGDSNGIGAGQAEDWAKSFGGGAKGDSEVNVTGKGWASIAEISMPKGSTPGKSGQNGETGKTGKGSGDDASGLMDSFGTKVSGKFGSGHVFSTRLVNALLTDDGKLYVGAVDKDALVNAANNAK